MRHQIKIAWQMMKQGVDISLIVDSIQQIQIIHTIILEIIQEQQTNKKRQNFFLFLELFPKFNSNFEEDQEEKGVITIQNLFQRLIPNYNCALMLICLIGMSYRYSI